MNRLLTHLRHVDLAVPDYDKQLDFYAGVWGLTKVAEDSGISFLAAEGSPEQYVVRLRKAEEKRLDLVSYGAASPADVDTLAEQLLAAWRAVDLAARQDRHPRRRLRLPLLRHRRPDHRGLRRRRRPSAPQDRGEGVHPGQAVARRPQLPRPGPDS